MDGRKKPGSMMVAIQEQKIETVLGVGRPPAWRRWLLPILALVVVIGGYFYVRGPQDAAQTVSLYETAAAGKGRLVVTVTATGTVEPTNLVEISSELSGSVKSVEVDFNTVVRKGQPLALLDTDKLESALAHSRALLDAKLARVREAQATLLEMEDQLARMTSLSERKVASQSSFSSAVAAKARADAALAVAQADVKVAEADLKTAETNLAKSCICSPIDGIVLERNVDVGQIVASSLQAPVLFTIAEDLTKMELKVDIDEADMGVVKVGKTATFTVEAFPGMSFPARIAELRYASQTVDGVVTYGAILSIDNKELLLRPGMTATAEILVEEIEDALLVPNAAFRFSPPVEKAKSSGGGLLGLIMPRPPQSPTPPPAPAADGTRILHVLKNGAPVAVSVRPGSSDGQMTAILEGDIAVGDAVITSMSAK
jgi:HlyD family secretion protein